MFTRFYHGYILPQKFGVDKRRVHLSALILTAQMTREAARLLLENLAYPSTSELEVYKAYFLKKWVGPLIDCRLPSVAQVGLIQRIRPSERPGYGSHSYMLRGGVLLAHLYQINSEKLLK